MLKKGVLAATAVLTAILLAACGESAKQGTETADAQTAQVEAGAETETTTPESDLKITSFKEDTNKEKETQTTAEKETTAPTKEAETTTAAAEKETTEAETTTAAGQEEKTGVVSADGDGLSLRSGPGSDNDILDLIPDGTTLVILEEQDGWGRVEYDGTEGWVSLDYVE